MSLRIWHLGETEEGDIAGWHEAAGRDYFVYGQPHGFVIIAADEAEARRLAKEADHHESQSGHWLEPSLTFCREIEPAGPARVVMGDWPTG